MTIESNEITHHLPPIKDTQTLLAENKSSQVELVMQIRALQDQLAQLRVNEKELEHQIHNQKLLEEREKRIVSIKKTIDSIKVFINENKDNDSQIIQYLNTILGKFLITINEDFILSKADFNVIEQQSELFKYGGKTLAIVPEIKIPDTTNCRIIPILTGGFLIVFSVQESNLADRLNQEYRNTLEQYNDELLDKGHPALHKNQTLFFINAKGELQLINYIKYRDEIEASEFVPSVDTELKNDLIQLLTVQLSAQQ